MENDMLSIRHLERGCSSHLWKNDFLYFYSPHCCRGSSYRRDSCCLVVGHLLDLHGLGSGGHHGPLDCSDAGHCPDFCSSSVSYPAEAAADYFHHRHFGCCSVAAAEAAFGATACHLPLLLLPPLWCNFSDGRSTSLFNTNLSNRKTSLPR